MILALPDSCLTSAVTGSPACLEAQGLLGRPRVDGAHDMCGPQKVLWGQKGNGTGVGRPESGSTKITR